MSTVYRRQRRRGGRVVKSATWYTRIDGKAVNLDVSDKQVAEQKTAALKRDMEREAVGLLPPKEMRLAAARRLSEHVVEFILDREACRRSESHITHLRGRLGRLLHECGWSVAADITADSFQTWRRKEKTAPKTVNEYLNSVRAFCNWMVAQGRMAVNPLARIDRAEERGRQMERRALTVEEVEKLIAGAGERDLYYLAAVHTGLRRVELESLKWGDLDLNDVRPCIRVRAATTKNHKSAVIPLHPQLVTAFRSIAPSPMDGGDLVFCGGLPRMRDMRKDFDAAGIAAIDTPGAQGGFPFPAQDVQHAVAGVGCGLHNSHESYAPQ
jgi:integrase